MEWWKRKGDEGRKGNTVQRIQQRNGKNSKSKQQHKHYFQFLIVRSFSAVSVRFGSLCVCVYVLCVVANVAMLNKRQRHKHCNMVYKCR